jgi:hypothetical protein
VAERLADGVALRVEDAGLRANENGRSHRFTAPGSARYSSNPIAVSRSNAST